MLTFNIYGELRWALGSAEIGVENRMREVEIGDKKGMRKVVGEVEES